jgi:tripeptide aminopeptidase
MNELNHLNLQKRLKDRFFRYIAIESQSQEGVNEVPSTPGQWTLARLLMRDLETLGLQGISINEHGVVQAHLPARLHESYFNIVMAVVLSAASSLGLSIR